MICFYIKTTHPVQTSGEWRTGGRGQSSSTLSPGTLRRALSSRLRHGDRQTSCATLPVGAAKPLFSPVNQLESMLKPLEGGPLTSPPLPVLDGGQLSFSEIHTNPLKC